jgi:DNA-binding MarR family transcriptional regulator
MYNELMLKFHSAALIGKIKEQVHNKILSELSRHHIEGIVPSHGDILVKLYENDGLSIKELAESIRRTQPTVTVLVNKLEQFGYVERAKQEEDARITSIMLTEKGRALEPVFREVSDALNETIYGGLTESESIQLEALLEKVIARFQSS